MSRQKKVFLGKHGVRILKELEKALGSLQALNEIIESQGLAYRGPYYSGKVDSCIGILEELAEEVRLDQTNDL